MANATEPPEIPQLSKDMLRRGMTSSVRTERLVRETWRSYYVARLAEAQFGPDSLEASIAQSRALEGYRELRESLHAIDPYYRTAARPPLPRPAAPRHLKLVPDEPESFDPPSGL
ncbi:MAG: hypothetical protein ABI311_12115 [Gemmatimonadaceae bacterium]